MHKFVSFKAVFTFGTTVVVVFILLLSAKYYLQQNTVTPWSEYYEIHTQATGYVNYLLNNFIALFLISVALYAFVRRMKSR